MTASASTTSYTASFNTSYLLTTAANPANGGTVSPCIRQLLRVGYGREPCGHSSLRIRIQRLDRKRRELRQCLHNSDYECAAERNGQLQAESGADHGGRKSGGPGVQRRRRELYAPATLSWTAGTTHTIATTSPQTAPGTQYAFQNWSDRGAISHQVVAPATATTYTASFAVAYQLTLGVTPSGSGRVSPASGTFYPAGTVVSISADANRGYLFEHRTGSVSSANSASTTVTMSAPETAIADFTEGRTRLAALLIEKKGDLNAREWVFAVGNLDQGPQTRLRSAASG